MRDKNPPALFAVLLIQCFIFTQIIYKLTINTPKTVEFTPTSQVVVTAEHVDAPANATLLWKDKELDKAVYLLDSYKAAAPAINSDLSFNDHHGRLVSCTDTEFVMAPDQLIHIYPGVSGTPVYYEGKAIGYISGWNGDGNVRCIFY